MALFLTIILKARRARERKMLKVITNLNKIHCDKPVKVIITDLSKNEMKNIKVADFRSGVITSNDKAIMVKNGRWYKIQTVMIEN